MHPQEIFIPSVGGPICLSLFHTKHSKGTILFLPGTSVYPEYYDAFINAFVKAGYSVAGVHVVGHGKSPRDVHAFTLDDMVQNTRDAITYCTEHKMGPLFLLGTSQGGIVASLAVANETRIKAVLIHDTIMPDLPETLSIIGVPPWLHPLYPFFTTLLNVVASIAPSWQMKVSTYLNADRISTSETLRDQFYTDPLVRRAYPLRFIASLFDVRMNVLTDGSIRVPVVLIAGGKDKLFALSYIEAIYDKLDAPQKKLLIIDDGTHTMFNESVDEIVVTLTKTIDSFC